MLLAVHSLAGGTVDEPSQLSALTRLDLFALLAGCSGVLACAGAADIPNTPDLSTLEAQYDQPTATLDQTTALETLNAMPSLQEITAGFRAAGYARSGVDDGGAEAGQSSTSRLNVQGSLKVTVRCPGDAATPGYGSNGALELTIGVEKNLVKRGIGGQATHCVLRGNVLGQPVRVELDGPLAIDFGHDFGLRQKSPDRILMNIRGSLDIQGYDVRNLSARWTEERLEYLFVMNDTDWVVAVVTADGTVSIKDKTSVWGCSDGQTCSKL